MTRRVLAFALVVLTIAVTACSVPRDDDARVVTNRNADSEAPVARRTGPRTSAKVYFVRTSDNKLESITTSVLLQESGDKPGPYELLEALILDGPQEQRLESKIPRNIRFEVRNNPVIEDEVIAILPDFHPDRISREALILAFQQMVFTLTELPTVNSVQFSVENKLFPVPLKNAGDVSGRGVRRFDYDIDTIFTTTTTTTTTTSSSTTAPPPSSTGPPASGAPNSAPGASNPQVSAPPASSR